MSLPGFDPLVLQLIERITIALPSETPAYLVGGAVRDMLRGHTTHDLDFVLSRDAIQTARRIAYNLNAAFYPLDPERDAGRLILTEPPFERFVVDFSSWRGADLESDLCDRDFTINAIALDCRKPDRLIDPLHGAADLLSGVLRPCSSNSLTNDPLRVLRAVRFSVNLALRMLPETAQQIQLARSAIKTVSPERLRDELFRILAGRSPATAIRLLDRFGVIAALLPELDEMKGVCQPPPHIHDVWNHSLVAVQNLDAIINVLSPQYDPERTANWTFGLLSLRLGRYRANLEQHLSERLNPERSLRALILLAALFHDAGKPLKRSEGSDGDIHFYGHDQLGESMIRNRAEALRLSRLEIDRLAKIIRHHMRPHQLSQTKSPLSSRSIYRFFRDTGEAGVDICLFSLADCLARHGAGLPQDEWIRQLDTARILLEAWWERREQKISPPALLNGEDLMKSLQLTPGPMIGKLLRELSEAQAADEVHTRAEALAFTRRQLNQG